jgi:hypothetical protein
MLDYDNEKTSTVRISSKALAMLEKMAKKDGRSHEAILEDALQGYRQSHQSPSSNPLARKSMWQKTGAMLSALLSRFHKKGKTKPTLDEQPTLLIALGFFSSKLANILCGFLLGLLSSQVLLISINNPHIQLRNAESLCLGAILLFLALCTHMTKHITKQYDEILAKRWWY